MGCGMREMGDRRGSDLLRGKLALHFCSDVLGEEVETADVASRGPHGLPRLLFDVPRCDLIMFMLPLNQERGQGRR